MQTADASRPASETCRHAAAGAHTRTPRYTTRLTRTIPVNAVRARRAGLCGPRRSSTVRNADRSTNPKTATNSAETGRGWGKGKGSEDDRRTYQARPNRPCVGGVLCEPTSRPSPRHRGRPPSPRTPASISPFSSRVSWSIPDAHQHRRSVGQVRHGSARTTQAVRRSIQRSQETVAALADRHGIDRKTATPSGTPSTGSAPSTASSTGSPRSGTHGRTARWRPPRLRRR